MVECVAVFQRLSCVICALIKDKERTKQADTKEYMERKATKEEGWIGSRL
jgi:hypothetical protein